MPQFDFSAFNVITQIFWFAICFFVLYFSMWKIILPRIGEILRVRGENITQNRSAAEELRKQIEDISYNSDQLKNASLDTYQASIDESNKEAIFHREVALRELKERIDKKSNESSKKISDFIKNSQEDCDKTIESLIKTITSNIFGGDLKNEDLAMLIDNQK